MQIIMFLQIAHLLCELHFTLQSPKISTYTLKMLTFMIVLKPSASFWKHFFSTNIAWPSVQVI